MRVGRRGVVILGCVGLLLSVAAPAQEILVPPSVITPHLVTVVSIVAPLLKTHWSQGAPFNMYDPGCGSACPQRPHQRLGCWSVAIAQIMYHMRLQPDGSQEYGVIDLDLTHKFDWKKIAVYSSNQSTYSETDPEARETALFCYYAAVVLKKTFLPAPCAPCDKDNSGYDTSSTERAHQIEAHYHCTADYKNVYPTDSEADRDSMEAVIARELKAGRPLMLYMNGYQWESTTLVGPIQGTMLYKKDTGHAVVIDGYGKSLLNNAFMVHLNFGWGGTGDGWYALWSDMTVGSPGKEHTVTLGRTANGKVAERKVLEIVRVIPVI